MSDASTIDPIHDHSIPGDADFTAEDDANEDTAVGRSGSDSEEKDGGIS